MNRRKVNDVVPETIQYGQALPHQHRTAVVLGALSFVQFGRNAGELVERIKNLAAKTITTPVIKHVLHTNLALILEDSRQCGNNPVAMSWIENRFEEGLI